jgi:coenzyme PQQ synthesis protein D (PqqD)
LKHVVIETLPKGRTEKLIIKELPDETLVYDLESDKAHCLNSTAGFIWRNCDGRRTVPELTSRVQEEFGTKFASDMVWLALDQLEEFKLLNETVPKPAHMAGISRRELVRNLGVAAAISIPFITSILVPTPAQAASCLAPTNRDDDCPCTSSTQCMTGCCRVVAGSQICKSGGGGCIP